MLLDFCLLSCCLFFIQLNSSNALNEGHQVSLISYSWTKLSKCCTSRRSVEGGAGRKGNDHREKVFTCTVQHWSHGTECRRPTPRQKYAEPCLLGSWGHRSQWPLIPLQQLCSHQAHAAPADEAVISHLDSHAALMDTVNSLTSDNNPTRPGGKGNLGMSCVCAAWGAGWRKLRVHPAEVYGEDCGLIARRSVHLAASWSQVSRSHGVGLRGDLEDLESRLFFSHLSQGRDK